MTLSTVSSTRLQRYCLRTSIPKATAIDRPRELAFKQSRLWSNKSTSHSIAPDNLKPHANVVTYPAQANPSAGTVQQKEQHVEQQQQRRAQQVVLTAAKEFPNTNKSSAQSGPQPARASIKNKAHYASFLEKLECAKTYVEKYGWPEKPYANTEAEITGK